MPSGIPPLRNFKPMLYLTAILLFGSAISNPATSGDLTVRFENVGEAVGTIRVALYKKQSEFMVESKAVLYNIKPSKSGIMEAKIENLPAGTYAFAVFWDKNNNLKLDKNLLGIPVEPYGFSKPPASKWRLPTWSEVSFQMTQSNQSMSVKLATWAAQ